MITIKPQESKNKDITYPCVGVNCKGVYIIFGSKGVGMCIESRTSGLKVGSYSDDWNMDHFTLYDAEVIIKQ